MIKPGMMHANRCAAALLFLIFTPILAPARADTFETQLGKVYEGSVLEEDDNYIYLDTASGVINIRRADIAKRNGEPYSSPVSAAAPVQSRPAQTAKPGYLGNYLSAEDRDLANLPRPGENIPAHFSSTGSSADGAGSIVSEAGDGHVIHSSGVTEKDLVDYHSAHPEEFRMPVQLLLKFLNPLTLKGKPEEIAKNPSSAVNWQDAGWKKKGETFNAPISSADWERIFSLKRGQAVHVKDSMGNSYVFWAVDRRESYLMPYDEARPKVLTKILQKQPR